MADRNKDLPGIVADILIELLYLRGDIKELHKDHKQHM